ncbi:MAG: hypothetical protein DRN27_05310 [Thermoplasmata archaeon]|nr:MAG: hypothetical protein DRN27_05310 [Thermoplasmata archaeon]
MQLHYIREFSDDSMRKIASLLGCSPKDISFSNLLDDYFHDILNEYHRYIYPPYEYCINVGYRYDENFVNERYPIVDILKYEVEELGNIHLLKNVALSSGINPLMPSRTILNKCKQVFGDRKGIWIFERKEDLIESCYHADEITTITFSGNNLSGKIITDDGEGGLLCVL